MDNYSKYTIYYQSDDKKIVGSIYLDANIINGLVEGTNEIVPNYTIFGNGSIEINSFSVIKKKKE